LSKYKKACATRSYKAKKNYQVTNPPPKNPSHCKKPSQEKLENITVTKKYKSRARITNCRNSREETACGAGEERTEGEGDEGGYTIK
jgi:hypothetical protein